MMDFGGRCGSASLEVREPFEVMSFRPVGARDSRELNF